MKDIFDETVLKGHTLKNRIFRSATWMAMACDNGFLNDEILSLYETLAKNGVAAIITGITSIYADDQKIQGMLSFSDESYIDKHKQLTETVHEYGSKIFMQIAIVDVIKDFSIDTINNLTQAEIKSIIQLFVNASINAQTAGYDGVQIHAAHFFFLSKFISPLYNNRDDNYGTDNQYGAKILIDILKSIKENTSDDFIVLIKINATDYYEGGLMIDDCVEICKILDENDIDAIEVSANNTSQTNITPGKNEAYFLDYATKIKEEVNCPVILVGGHRSIDSMNNILNTTDIEYLSLSRPLICQPDLIKRWMNNDKTPSKCKSCNSCYNTINHKCILN